MSFIKWTIGPESECKCFVNVRKMTLYSSLCSPLNEYLLETSGSLFPCFVFTSPKLDGVRVTNTGPMLLCLKYIRWHEQRRILCNPYRRYEKGRCLEMLHGPNAFSVFTEANLLKAEYWAELLCSFLTLYPVRQCNSDVLMLVWLVFTGLLVWRTG